MGGSNFPKQKILNECYKQWFFFKVRQATPSPIKILEERVNIPRTIQFRGLRDFPATHINLLKKTQKYLEMGTSEMNLTTHVNMLGVGDQSCGNVGNIIVNVNTSSHPPAGEAGWMSVMPAD